MFRKLDILGGEESNSPRVQTYLFFATWFYIVMPFVVLLGWFLLMLYDRVKEEKPIWGPFCILTAGLCFLLFGFNACRIKWTNFRVKPINVIAGLVCFLLLTAYQTFIIFGYKSDEKFFPYSAFFLNINVILVSILVYFSKYQDVQDIGYIVKKFFPLSGVEPDRDREVNLLEEIEEHQNNPEWKLCYEDLTDFITISKVSNEKFKTILGSGLVATFNAKPLSVQRMVKGIILFLSVLPLAALSLLLYLNDDKSKLGIITSVSVVLMDVFSFLIYHSDMVDSPIIVVILLITNRIMMVSLGSSYFIYGYMLLYIMYSFAFVYNIAKNRFPFEGDVVL